MEDNHEPTVCDGVSAAHIVGLVRLPLAAAFIGRLVASFWLPILLPQQRAVPWPYMAGNSLSRDEP
jgi:hypothetical protein